MQNTLRDVVDAIRNGRPVADPKLEALRAYTNDVVETRGWPSAEATARFESAGYSNQHVLEVVLGVGMKTLSNYTNHIAGTSLDAQFAQAAWELGGAVKG